jgi:hypothetical protein
MTNAVLPTENNQSLCNKSDQPKTNCNDIMCLVHLFWTAPHNNNNNNTGGEKKNFFLPPVKIQGDIAESEYENPIAL